MDGTDDPFDFFANKKETDIVTSIVDSSSKNGIYVHVGNKNLSIFIKQNQLAKESINARPSRFTRGDRVDSMIIEKNNSKKTITLSIKALEEKQSKDVLKKYGSEASGGVLGELLGPLIKKKKVKNNFIISSWLDQNCCKKCATSIPIFFQGTWKKFLKLFFLSLQKLFVEMKI